MSDSQKSAEKALQKLADQLTCSVCLETYRDPKLLPCLHVFCTTCLERLVCRDGTSLTCPNCRRTTRPPQGGVSQLQSAFYINHLLDMRDTLEKVKATKAKCDKCGKEDTKGNCGEFVCDLCINMHEGVTSHKIALLDEVQAEAINVVPTKKTTMACSKHPGKPNEIYCETCEELICSDCTVKTHRDHEYDLAVDCFPKHLDAITASLQPVKQQLDTVNQAVGEIDDSISQLSEQTVSAKQKIKDEIDRLHDALEARKRELVAHVDQAAKQTEKTIQAQRANYELTQPQLSSCLEYVQESLRTGSQEEILSMKKQVMERMEQIEKEFDPLKFQPDLEQSLHFSHLRLTEACQGFGEIFSTPLCLEKCYATGEGVHSFRTLKDVAVTLTLQTVDTREQPCTDTKAPVTGKLVSRVDGSVVKCEVTRKKGNTYELKYQPRTAGEHNLHIKVYGRHIKDSPFTVTVGGFQGIHMKMIKGVKEPRQLATTANGEMVVAEGNANCISVRDTNGRKLRSFGDAGTGDSKLERPAGVTHCSDNTILVASNSHCVKRFTLEGRFITSVGSEGSGQLQFQSPWAITFNPTNKKVYVCDTHNHRIQVLNSDLTFSRMIGSRGSGPGEFECPEGIAVDRTGNIHVADHCNNRIQVFSPSGQLLQTISQRGPGMGTLEGPISVCIDSHNFIYVLEFDVNRVSVFNSEGNIVKSFGQGGHKAGQFKNPYAIAVDTIGHVYVSDTGNNRIQIFN